MQALTVELSTLKDELASARAAKTALQTQAAELKTALQSLLNQNKVFVTISEYALVYFNIGCFTVVYFTME